MIPPPPQSMANVVTTRSVCRPERRRTERSPRSTVRRIPFTRHDHADRQGPRRRPRRQGPLRRPGPRRRPRRRDRPGRRQRCRQVDLAAHPGRAASRPSRAASRSTRPPRRSATSRRSPTGAPARRSGRSSAGARAWRPRRRRWTPRPRRSPRAGPAPTTRTPTALERWLALGGADLDERLADGRPRLLARPADDRAVRRPGGPRGPGVAAAQPLRHLPARRADQRPRPRRPGPAGGVRHRAARRHGRGQPRPRVPRPHGDQRARAGPAPAAGQPLRRRLRVLPGRARGGPPARPRRLRRVRADQGQPGGAGAYPARTGWRTASATPAASPRTTTRSAASSVPRRPRSRPPRRGRPSG